METAKSCSDRNPDSSEPFPRQIQATDRSWPALGRLRPVDCGGNAPFAAGQTLTKGSAAKLAGQLLSLMTGSFLTR
jgi:hypothetical protein